MKSVGDPVGNPYKEPIFYVFGPTHFPTVQKVSENVSVYSVGKPHKE